VVVCQATLGHPADGRS